MYSTNSCIFIISLIIVQVSVFVGCGSPLLNSTSKDPVSVTDSIDRHASQAPLSGTMPVDSSKVKVFEKYKLSVSISWLVGPYSDPRNENQIEIILTDATGSVVELPEGLEFHFWAFMPSMGHGSADDGYIEMISKGVYKINEFYLPHGGTWELKLEIIKNGEVDDAVVFITTLANH